MVAVPLPRFTEADSRDFLVPPRPPEWPQPGYPVPCADQSVREEPLVLPASGLLQGALAPGWEIVEPLPITIECDENGRFIVGDNIFLVYGDGPTLGGALADFADSLITYYELVVDGLERNPCDQAVLDRLRRYLRPV